MRIGIFHEHIVTQPSNDVWVAFGVGRKYRFNDINTMHAGFGGPKSPTLPEFHWYSGCDTTSAFMAKLRGKLSRLEGPVFLIDVAHLDNSLDVRHLSKIQHSTGSATPQVQMQIEKGFMHNCTRLIHRKSEIGGIKNRLGGT